MPRFGLLPSLLRSSRPGDPARSSAHSVPQRGAEYYSKYRDRSQSSVTVTRRAIGAVRSVEVSPLGKAGCMSEQWYWCLHHQRTELAGQCPASSVRWWCRHQYHCSLMHPAFPSGLTSTLRTAPIARLVTVTLLCERSRYLE